MSTWIEYNFVDHILQDIADELEYNKPLHMTLLHFPRNIDEDDVEILAQRTENWTEFFPDRFIANPIGGPVNFDNGAAVQRFTLPIKVWDQRMFLQQQLFDRNIKWSNNYEWNPHVTIGWDRPVSNAYYIPPITILAVTLHHSFGDPIKWWLKP